MDRVDVAILREMTQGQLILPGRPGITPSNREISRKLGLPPGTIWYRIKRLYASGIIKGSWVSPNPSLLGLSMRAFTVDVPPLLDKAKVIEGLRRVDGVVSAHDFVGSLLWVTFVYESEEALGIKLKQIREIAGAEGIHSSIPYPPCTASLTKSEAELILRLLKGGFDSYGSLAREMGITVRTLERRFSKLVKEGSIISLPKVDYKAMTGCVPADLLVLFENPEAARASPRTVLPLIGDRVILAALWDVVGMCSMVLPDVASVTEVAEKIRRLDGVSMARVEIVRDHIDQMGILEGYIERWMLSKGLKVSALHFTRTMSNASKKSRHERNRP